MKRNTANIIVDIIIFFAMVFIFISGFVLWGWLKPSAPGEPAQILWGLFEGKTFLGMTKNGGWKLSHCYVAVAVLLPLMILHLALHWNWIHSVLSSFGRTTREKPQIAPDKKENEVAGKK